MESPPRRNERPLKLNPTVHKSNRILISKIKLDENTLFVINIYAPCADTEKLNFFTELRKTIEENIKQEDWENIICLGDF